MGDHVKVDPAELRFGSHLVAGWHDDTVQVFDSGHSRIDEASSGWVGASASALAERMDSLKSSARAVTSRMNDHSTKFALSADEYETQDESSGAEISRTVAPPPTGGTRYLNL
ncbi:WXG100 family type VII secretion target [Gordonia sesuvii]|uniref:WXG100 family type VII secretion target n=1 Tax=Gordonia sesuvii TaxID=3116777 RepID=UPI003D66FB76